MNKFNMSYLCKLAALLKQAGWRADVEHNERWGVDHNSYLIRYGSNRGYNRGAEPLLLMGDFGITWEPSGVYPTEPLGFINGDNPKEDVELMIELANTYYDAHYPDETSITIEIPCPEKKELA